MFMIGWLKQIDGFYKKHQTAIDNIMTVLLFLYCSAVTFFGAEVIGTVVLSVLWCFVLVLTDSLIPCLAPLLLTCVFVTKCADPYNAFLPYLWFIIPVVLALIVHFYRFRRSCEIGLSFHGLCAVSFALLLGGLGTISPAEYLDPITLYYSLGLGIGMLAVYVIFAPYVKYEKGKTPSLFVCLYLMGLLCLVNIACTYVQIALTEGNSFSFSYLGFRNYYHGRNETATALMLALPIPCYFVRQNRFHILSVFAMYGGLLMTGSRGGIVLGTVELIIILVVMCIVDRHSRLIYGGALATLLLLWLFAIKPLLMHFHIVPNFFYRDKEGVSWLRLFIDEVLHSDDARIQMLRGLPEEFASNPIFGTGIGWSGRQDIYAPSKGFMHWYHMWFAQVIGSLGIVGIIAYVSNFFVRFYTVLRHRSLYSAVVWLSYFGLFLMSQVNPGEFCPLPYAMVAVLLFASIDQNLPSKKASSL